MSIVKKSFFVKVLICFIICILSVCIIWFGGVQLCMQAEAIAIVDDVAIILIVGSILVCCGVLVYNMSNPNEVCKNFYDILPPSVKSEINTMSNCINLMWTVWNEIEISPFNFTVDAWKKICNSVTELYGKYCLGGELISNVSNVSTEFGKMLSSFNISSAFTSSGVATVQCDKYILSLYGADNPASASISEFYGGFGDSFTGILKLTFNNPAFTYVDRYGGTGLCFNRGDIAVSYDFTSGNSSFTFLNLINSKYSFDVLYNLYLNNRRIIYKQVGNIWSIFVQLPSGEILLDSAINSGMFPNCDLSDFNNKFNTHDDVVKYLLALLFGGAGAIFASQYMPGIDKYHEDIESSSGSAVINPNAVPGDSDYVYPGVVPLNVPSSLDYLRDLSPTQIRDSSLTKSGEIVNPTEVVDTSTPSFTTLMPNLTSKLPINLVGDIQNSLGSLNDTPLVLSFKWFDIDTIYNFPLENKTRTYYVNFSWFEPYRYYIRGGLSILLFLMGILAVWRNLARVFGLGVNSSASIVFGNWSATPAISDTSTSNALSLPSVSGGSTWFSDLVSRGFFD